MFDTTIFQSDELDQDVSNGLYNYLFILDISNFSSINKSYGKAVGDKILVEVYNLLQFNIHNKAKLYKIESDRFVIITYEQGVKRVEYFAQQLISFFDTKCVCTDEFDIDISFNIGVSKIIDNISNTMVNCEYALESSKKLGSRHFEIYDEFSVEYLEEKEALLWLNKTKEIVLNDGIFAYYQPIKNLKNDKIEKYEVLARGKCDDEIIEPLKFVKSAKRLGILTSITKTIIKKSFEAFSKNSYDFSINLTDRDLVEGYLSTFLAEKLHTYNINPNRVTFEILENIVINTNEQKISQQITELKDMGFSIAVDDFGIENSNFERLLDMKVDVIKIDGAFISNLRRDDKTVKIVQTIVKLAKSLGMQTVAEYVYDEYTYNAMKELGIDYAQGHFIGKAEAFIDD